MSFNLCTASSRVLLAVAAAAGGMACDETVVVENIAPAAQPVAYCRDGDRYFIALRVRDYERAPVDVDLTAEVGGSSLLLPDGSSGDGRTGLTSIREAPGRLHHVEWGTALEVADACDDDACALRPCATDDCETTCDTLGEQRCARNCEALAAARGGTAACGPRPGAPPGRLIVTARAADPEGAEGDPTSATLSLRDGCGCRHVDAAPPGADSEGAGKCDY